MKRVKQSVFLYPVFAFLAVFLTSLSGEEKQPDPLTLVPYRVCERAGEAHLTLDRGWLFGAADAFPKTAEEAASVDRWREMPRPMSVEKALSLADDLPDPYEHLHSAMYDWLHTKSWCDKKTFTAAVQNEDGYVYLSFEGIDYYSAFWLNGQRLGAHEGMFGGPVFEVSSLLNQDGENELLVAVDSALRREPEVTRFKVGRAIKPWGTAAGDNAKPFFSCGLWRGARIDFVPKTHLERPYLTTKSADEKLAILHLQTEILSGVDSTKLELHPPKNRQLIDLSDGGAPRAKNGDTRPYSIRVTLTDSAGKSQTEEFPVDVRPGRGWFETDLTVDHPDLWYPNRIGGQPLYSAALELSRGSQIIDSVTFPFGIRTIEWIDTPGPRLADRWGKWQCVVNGRKFFVKGINWIPIDALLDLPREKYRWYLQMAADAGIEMIRIWGPGLRESDEFYDICDQLGLMVWQDFPLGNADASPWPQDVWEEQALLTIFRLRNRASLAVWCGGNEFNPYCPGNSALIGILERSLAIFDPSRKFLRTSPDEGSFHCYPNMDPTWYKKRFAEYPAMAESGIHSIASARTLSSGIINTEEFDHIGTMYDESFRELCPESLHHFVEYIPSRIPRMLSRASHFADMKTLTVDDMALAAGLGAGEFYQLFSEGMQGNYPTTALMLPWVFARSWPVISAVQLVDGAGQPAAPYYFLKRTYEPIHACFDLDRLLWRPGEAFRAGVKILNLNTGAAGEGQLRVEILSDRFETLRRWEVPCAWDAAPSVSSETLESWTIPDDYTQLVASRFFFVVTELRQGENLISRSVLMPRVFEATGGEEFYQQYIAEPVPWPTMEKGLPLKTALAQGPQTILACEQTARQTRIDGRYRITTLRVKVSNRGEVPSPITCLDLEELGPVFYAEDDFFYLPAGEARELSLFVREDADKEPLPLRPVVRSWNAR